MSQTQKPNPAQLYEDYLVPGMHAPWTPVILRHASPGQGDHVLDVACGTGIVARNVAPLVGNEGRVVGVDVSPDMLEVAREQPEPSGADIQWRQGDAASLPASDDAYDVALCQQGLQFISDRPAAVREMRRALIPGGTVGATVWQGIERHPLYRALCEAQARHLDVPLAAVATPFSLGDEGALARLFADAGFDSVAVSQESHTIRFHTPQRFVNLTLLAAASIIPESDLNAEGRQEMVREVSSEIQDTLDDYVDGDSVAFPMHAHIVVARA